MSTIIMISTNEHGTGISTKLMATFPEAINVRASLCTIKDVRSLDYSKIIIVEEFDRAMDHVKEYILNKASENLEELTVTGE
jgi:hypothetical protein